jgi:hypothetical protein
MKTRTLALIVLISLILSGISLLGFLELHDKAVIRRQSRQHQIPEPNGGRSASISKNTILFLLCVGIIGALSVRRRQKSKRRTAIHNHPQKASEDRNKAFVKLNKQYLNLQYKIAQHKFSGDSPPDRLLKEISDLERQVRLISRALE